MRWYMAARFSDAPMAGPMCAAHEQCLPAARMSMQCVAWDFTYLSDRLRCLLRAGRLGPGLCLRLWAEKAALADAPQPEILDADLASLALALALRADRSAAEPAGCGAQGPADPGGVAGLRWLDTPPAEALAATQALLRLLGAVDAAGAATAAGEP